MKLYSFSISETVYCHRWASTSHYFFWVCENFCITL